ncbi:histidine kinase [Kineosporia sp. NBRC 101731]|uniref:sensor histidine kinase n=1 Tax=Kineosporia sp. NBRC 101731 TaxID=3032199 RepID=UPI00249FD53A|nr:histidine kinase [Kineosporia sp. NBRC 101731]GLY29923.1 hypothetical protein Kisp02_32880 [Kineosporia sp. NBRC 101731]
MAALRAVTRTLATWWKAVRGASAGRVVYECGLVLLCSAVNFSAVIIWSPGETPTAAQVLAAIGAGLSSLILVPLRLTRPVTALVLGSLASIPAGGITLLVAVLSASTGYRAKKPLAIVGGYLIALAASLAGILLQPENQELGRGGAVLIAVTTFASFAVLPGAIAAMIAQRRLLVMTMHQRNLELHQERLLVAGQAQARERNRIAAELHDSLGHRLTLISLYAGGLAQSETQSATPTPASGPTSSSTQAVGLLRDTSAQAMGELRQILKVLHQDESVTGSARTLGEVEQTVTAARQTGTPIELVRVGEPRPLTLLAEHAAFRVVQEGLTNALKHASGAAVRVEVRYEDDALFVEVRNLDGRPHVGPSSGQGLLGLAERVRLAGGVLSHGPVDAGGFRLGAMLPYGADVPTPVRTAETGDFPQDIRRSSRRQRIGLVAVIAALVLSLGSCIGAVVTIPAPMPVDIGVYRSIRVGDDQDRLRHLLTDDQKVSARVTENGERCETYAGDISEQPDYEDYEINYEFCYEDDVLVSKQRVRTEGT